MKYVGPMSVKCGLICGLFSVYGAAEASFPNPVESGVTISNGTWNANGELTVGEATANHWLDLVSGSSVQSTSGYIGFLGTASSNRVSVDSSTWVNDSKLYVGFLGEDNALEILNRGMVQTENGYIGFEASADSNRVFIASRGFLNVEHHLEVGGAGSGNAVQLDGGYLYANSATVGRGLGSSGNSVQVFNGGRFLATDDLILGDSGSDNRIDVSNGGYVGSRSRFIIGVDEQSGFNQLYATGSNSTVSARTLLLGDRGHHNFFAVGNGALVDTYEVFIGAEELAEDNQIQLSAVGTVLNAYTLQVGDGGSDNQFAVFSGAEASVFGNALVGMGSNSVRNLVLIDGAGSKFSVDGELHIGVDGDHNQLLIQNGGLLETKSAFVGSGSDAAYNRVDVGEGSSWTNRNTLHLQHQSTLRLGLGASVSTATYFQDASSMLTYDFSASAPSGIGHLSVSGDAVFEEGSSIDFNAPIGALTPGEQYTLLTAGQIISGSLTNDMSALLPARFLMDVGVDVEGGTASLNVERRTMAQAFELHESELAPLLNEIDEMAGHNPQAEMMLQSVNRGMSTNKPIAQALQQLYGRRPVVVHAVEQARVASIGQINTHVRTVQETKYDTPVGTRGPHKASQGWAPWVKGYGGKGTADQKDAFSGYTARSGGAVFGVDRSIGTILGGLAAGYSQSSVNQDDGGQSDVNTYYGSMYGSVGVRRWYMDLNASYGRSLVDTASGAGFGSSASYGANDYAGYIGVGRQSRYRRWRLKPQLGLYGGYYDQESYVETSTLGVSTEVDAYDRWSLRSSLGLSLAYEHPFKHMIAKPEIRASWLHEFNADEEHLGYGLVGGNGSYTYALRSPDEDTLELAAGVQLLFADRLKFTIDFAAELSEFYEGYSASGRLAYEF